MDPCDPSQSLCPLCLPCILWNMETGGETEAGRVVTGSTWAGKDSNYPPLQLLTTWMPLRFPPHPLPSPTSPFLTPLQASSLSLFQHTLQPYLRAFALADPAFRHILPRCLLMEPPLSAGVKDPLYSPLPSSQ